MCTTNKHAKSQISKYTRVVVRDSNRTDAMCQFLADLVHKGETPGIVYVRTLEHAELLAIALTAVLGRLVPMVSSKTPKKERKELALRLKGLDPTLPLVVSTAVWSTGLDIPTLAWILLAGAGAAPVGLKQTAGRPTRVDKSGHKIGYTIYDWIDEGPDAQWLELQALKRQAHYRAVGFSIESLRLLEDEEADDDARALGALLAAGRPPPPPAEAAPREWAPRNEAERRGAMLAKVLAVSIVIFLLFAFAAIVIHTCNAGQPTL